MSRPSILVVAEPTAARELLVRLEALGYGVAGLAPVGQEAAPTARDPEPPLILVDARLGGVAQTDPSSEPVVYVAAAAAEPSESRVDSAPADGLKAAIEAALVRQEADMRLRRVERWATAAIDEAGDAVLAAEPDGIVVHLNPAAEAITDWTRGEAVGRDLGAVLRLAHRASGRPVPLDCLKDGPVVRHAADTVLVTRSGYRVPVDVTASLVPGENGGLAGIVAVVRGTAGRHASLTADVALAAAQAATTRGMLQLCAESVVRNLDAAFARIWTVNATGDTLLLQASAGRYTHLDGPHARVPVGGCGVGRIAKDHTPLLTNNVPGDPRFTDREWATREGMVGFAGHPLLVDDRLVGVIGLFSRRPVANAALAALKSVASTIAVGIERKQLEEQLRQSQKMEAVGLLAGGVAHDFNNLLTIINGYSEIIQAQLSPESPVLGLVREIAQAGNQAAGLTRQLLAFSRNQVLEPKVLYLHAVVTDLENLLGRLIGEDITLTTVTGPGVGRVRADPGQVEQVLMNLVINARDAMPRGGRITIETANADLDVTYTQTVPDLKPGPYVLLAVSDTGVGMNEATRTRIFEPFFTTKGPGKGTGLGLATVYGIIKQSGGHIAVYSVPNQGTTIKIYLPRVQDAPAAPKSHHGLSLAARGTETILLAEDEPAVRALARHVLRLHGYTVLEAGHGKEALRVAGEHRGPIHLVVTDVIMPGMSGRQLTDQLVAARAGVRVLYLSGYTDDAVVRHGVLQADVAFLQKPFTPTSLAQKVRDVLDADPG